MTYKVLNTGHSVCAYGKAQVKYKRNEWAVAPDWLAQKGYHLTYFKSLARAKELALGDNEIWECEVEGEVSPLPQLSCLGDLAKGLLFPFSLGWPDGTGMAEKIMITKRIQLAEETK